MHAVLNEHWLVKADTIVEMYLLLLILLYLSLLQTSPKPVKSGGCENAAKLRAY